MSVTAYRVGKIVFVTFGGVSPYLGPNLSETLATGLPKATVETYSAVSAWDVGNNNSLYASIDTAGRLTFQNRNNNTLESTRIVGEVVYITQ